MLIEGFLWDKVNEFLTTDPAAVTVEGIIGPEHPKNYDEKYDYCFWLLTTNGYHLVFLNRKGRFRFGPDTEVIVVGNWLRERVLLAKAVFLPQTSQTLDLFSYQVDLFITCSLALLFSIIRATGSEWLFYPLSFLMEPSTIVDMMVLLACLLVVYFMYLSWFRKPAPTICDRKTWERYEELLLESQINASLREDLLISEEEFE